MPAKFRRKKRSRPFAPVLWVAAGAAVGVLLGVAIADRSGAGRAIGRRLGGARHDDSGEPHGVPAFDAGEAEFDDSEWEPEGEKGDYEDENGLDARVLAAFEQDPVLSERSIVIDAPDEGTIRLTGHVPRERDVAHAVTIARGTPGVERVEHRISVHAPERDTADDESGV